MSLLQQVIQLLSESPGNIVFHLVTLFALQAVLAISLSQWRRDPANREARRMSAAAGALVLARVALLVVGLWLNSQAEQAPAMLPPLEQALNTATVVLLVWALAPHPARFPRLGDALLLMALLAVAVMAFSFTQSWQAEAAAGDAYNSSQQATIWGLLQIVILVAGVTLTLLDRHRRVSLHPLVLGLLLLAHLAHFWNYPEIIATGTNIPYWIRLGHLVAFPLWAVLVYRQSLFSLLAARPARPATTQIETALQLSAHVIDSLDQEETIRAAIHMAGAIVDARFVGVALLDEDDRQQLELVSNQPQVAADRPRSWQLRLDAWPPLQQAVEQKQGLELLPEGPGARQLHRLYTYLEVGPLGALLVEPLPPGSPADSRAPLGLLLLAKREDAPAWPDRDKKLARALGAYLAQALANARRHADALQRAETTAPSLPTPDPAVVSGRIIALEEEREQLLANLETANNRLLQAETRAATAVKRAEGLAATIDEMERLSQDERVEALATEIETLRESLKEAEEALALASAGEGGLSTDWVMLTITRYSGQLEEAQARIETLEGELARREQGLLDEVLVSLVQELRTPMTSIAGYTALLLGETMGILGVRQREFLQRVQANTERMGALLDQIVQLTTGQEQPARPEEEWVDVREVIETAASAIITQVREKRLNLNLDVADDLPPLAVSRHALHQIVTNLLGNACQSSSSDGHIAVSVYADTVAAGHNGDGERIHFVHLAVSDSGGGIAVEDRPRVFEAQHRADSPLIAGIGDTGAGLAVARSLTLANGGRIWVDSELGVGSTFSVLFPVGIPEAGSESQTVTNGHAAGGA